MEIKKGQLVVVAIVIAIFGAGLGSSIANIETFSTCETNFDYVGDVEPYFVGTDADIEVEHNVRENITGYYPATTTTTTEFLTESPTIYATISGLSAPRLWDEGDVKDAYACPNYVAVLLNDGSLYTAGSLRDYSGGQPFIDPWFTLLDENVSSMSASLNTLIYLKSDKTLWGVGQNSPAAGTIYADPTYLSYHVPVKIADNVSTYQCYNGNVSYEIGTSLYFAQLGFGSGGSKTVPSLVYTGYVSSYCSTPKAQYYVVGDTLYARGNNTYGQLGNGTTTSSTSWVSVNLPSSDFGWIVVSNGNTTFAYTLGDVSENAYVIYGWGDNQYGQVGASSSDSKITAPARVMTVTSVIDPIIAQSTYSTMIATAETLYQTEIYFTGRNYGQITSLSAGNVDQMIYTEQLLGRPNSLINSTFVWALNVRTPQNGNVVYYAGDNSYDALGIGNTDYIDSTTTRRGQIYNMYDAICATYYTLDGVYTSGSVRKGTGMGTFVENTGRSSITCQLGIPSAAYIVVGTAKNTFVDMGVIHSGGEELTDYTGVGGIIIASTGEGTYVSTMTTTASSTWATPTFSTSQKLSNSSTAYISATMNLKTGAVYVNSSASVMPDSPTSTNNNFSGTMTIYTLESGTYALFPNYGLMSWTSARSSTVDRTITITSPAQVASGTLTYPANTTGKQFGEFEIEQTWSTVIDSTMFTVRGGIAYTASPGANTYVVPTSTAPGMILSLSLTSSLSNGSYITTVSYSGVDGDSQPVSGTFTVSENELSGRNSPTNLAVGQTKSNINNFSQSGVHFIPVSALYNGFTNAFPSATQLIFSVSTSQYPIFALSASIDSKLVNVDPYNSDALHWVHVIDCRNYSSIIEVSNNIASMGTISCPTKDCWLVFGNSSTAAATVSVAANTSPNSIAYVDPRFGVTPTPATLDFEYAINKETAPYLVIKAYGENLTGAIDQHTWAKYTLKVRGGGYGFYVYVNAAREGDFVFGSDGNGTNMPMYTIQYDNPSGGMSSITIDKTFSGAYNTPWSPITLVVTADAIYYTTSTTVPTIEVSSSNVVTVTGAEGHINIDWGIPTTYNVSAQINGDRNTCINTCYTELYTSQSVNQINSWDRTNQSATSVQMYTSTMEAVPTTESTNTVWRNGYINSTVTMVVEPAVVTGKWFAPILSDNIGSIISNGGQYAPYQFSLYRANDTLYFLYRELGATTYDSISVGDYEYAQISLSVNRITNCLDIEITPITRWTDFQTHTLLLTPITLSLQLSSVTHVYGIIQIMWYWPSTGASLTHLVTATTIFLPSGGLYESDATLNLVSKFPDISIFKLIVNAVPHAGDSVTLSLNDTESITYTATDKGLVINDKVYAYKDIEIYYVSSNVGSKVIDGTTYDGGIYIGGTYFEKGHMYVKTGKYASLTDIGETSTPVITMDGTWAFSTLAYSGENIASSGTRLSEPGGFNWSLEETILVFAAVMLIASILLIWKFGYNIYDILMLAGSIGMVWWYLS